VRYAIPVLWGLSFAFTTLLAQEFYLFLRPDRLWRELSAHSVLAQQSQIILSKAQIMAALGFGGYGVWLRISWSARTAYFGDRTDLGVQVSRGMWRLRRLE
jgi:hypothetical protein